jgi:hypothetical protein
LCREWRPLLAPLNTWRFTALRRKQQTTRTTRNAPTDQKFILPSQNSEEPLPSLSDVMCCKHVCISAAFLMPAPFERGLAESLKTAGFRYAPPDYFFAFSARPPINLLEDASKAVCSLSTQIPVRPEILEICPSTIVCLALQSCIVAMLRFVEFPPVATYIRDALCW